MDTLLSSIQSIFDINRGIKLQSSAGNYTYQGFMNQIPVVREAAEYNIQLDSRNLDNQLDVFTRNVGRALSTQRSQVRASGFSLNSESALDITNATLDSAVRQAKEARTNLKIQADQRRYNAEVQVTLLKNQAALARYEAENLAYQNKVRRNKLLPDLFNQAYYIFNPVDNSQ